MDERSARIAFNMIPEVGAVAVSRLAAECGGSVAAAYARYPRKLDWEGREPDWERELELAERMQVQIVTDIDPEYPPQLRALASPPLALYVVGDAQSLAKGAVALVGTRGATGYGRDTAEKFAFGLVQRGWSVVSGLARGIDAAAHRGALAGNGTTIGVLGGALDRFYPEENRELARQMVEKGGCVVSEFPFGRNPDIQTFPQRNRVVAGLVRGVVAVECPLHSGTLITCARALELGRPVMAVPGRIDWKCAEGCLHLIREGARMVTSVDDVEEELSTLMELSAKAPPKSEGRPMHRERQTSEKSEPVAPEIKLSPEEATVLRAIPAEGATIDSVVRTVRMDAAKVGTLLVGLRMKGRVRFLPGNRVCAKS